MTSSLFTPADTLKAHASADAVDSFIAWRKLTKKPLTDRAAMMIAKSLTQITAGGGDADEALDTAQERGWQTIKPEWYWRTKDEQPRTSGKEGKDQGGAVKTNGARERALRAAEGFGKRSSCGF